MAYGIEITNASGHIQITEQFSNYQLVATGTVLSATPNSSLAQISYPAQAGNAVPLVFVRPHFDGVYVGGCIVNNSSSGLFGLPLNTANITCSGAFDYRLYGITGTIALDASTYGFQVMDSSSNVIYDSRKTVAQVQDVVVVNTIWPASGPGAPFAPYDSPSVPISKTFTSFGQRPWFMVNNLQNIDLAGGQGLWACAIDPSANTSKLLFSDGETDGSGNWVPYTASGASPGYTQGFAGGQCIVPLAICY